VPQIDALRFEAIQRLLGDTIGISDAQWREPSRLPGWSRAHVATHLARDGDLIYELTTAGLAGREPDLPTPQQRFAALERGAERTGVELQIDLDTSAGRLGQAWSEVSDWHRPIHFQGRVQPLAVLPLARLNEICMHHLDLRTEFSLDQIGEEAAGWLLAWVYSLLAPRWQRPVVEVISSTGQGGILGSGTKVIGPVRGTDADLWAWLTGRGGPENLTGAGSVRFPLFG
jgi:maleylpyruvate isomerase